MLKLKSLLILFKYTTTAQAAPTSFKWDLNYLLRRSRVAEALLTISIVKYFLEPMYSCVLYVISHEDITNTKNYSKFFRKRNIQ